MSWYPRHQRIHFINPIAESLLQLIPQDSCLSLDSTNTDLREAICRVITFWRRDQHQLNTRQVARLTRSIKLNNDRSLSALTRILLNTKLVINAVKNELAWSDAPFLSTTVAPKHPVELFRHLTHKIGNTSSLSRPKEATVNANFGQLSFLSGRVCLCSTLRRYAIATPASVHCMSRQLVFGDLSCIGFRR